MLCALRRRSHYLPACQYRLCLSPFDQAQTNRGGKSSIAANCLKRGGALHSPSHLDSGPPPPAHLPHMLRRLHSCRSFLLLAFHSPMLAPARISYRCFHLSPGGEHQFLSLTHAPIVLSSPRPPQNDFEAARQLQPATDAFASSVCVSLWTPQPASGIPHSPGSCNMFSSPFNAGRSVPHTVLASVTPAHNALYWSRPRVLVEAMPQLPGPQIQL